MEVHDSEENSKDKGPNLDSFSMAFFQSYRDVVKGNLKKMFQELFSFQQFEKSLNAIFLTLIPMQAGAVEVKHFGPISLVNGIYKIISKLLTNRLREVLDKIVTKLQNAFVWG